MKTLKLILAGSFLILAATIDPAPAQHGGVVFVPPITPGDCVKWLHINVLADSGGACGGTGSPGGSNTQVQFNSSSSFGGITGVTSNGTLMTFAAGDLVLTGAVSGDIGTFTAGHALQDSGTLLSSLAPLASPTFSGTTTAAALTISGITGSTQCLHASTAGVVSGTGSDCGSGGGTGNALFGTTTGNTTNDIVTMSNTTVGVKDSGTLLSSLAPLASPTFTGTVTAAAINLTGLLNDTGAEGSQYALTLGGQQWKMNMVSGGAFYIYDATGSHTNLQITQGSTNSLLIGSSTNAFTGPITGTTSLSLGTQQTTQGSIVLDNTAGGAYATTLKSSNSASAAYTLTLPTTAGTNGYFLSTDGSGNTSWAAAAGGSGCTVAGGAQYQILVNNGSSGCSSSPSASVNLGALSLGASGTLGSVAMGNATSGTVTLSPVAGALGSVTASLPANTGAISELNYAQTWTGAQTFTNGDMLLKGSSSGAMTLEAPAVASSYVMTFPAATDTVDVVGTAQTFTAAKTFTNSDIKLLGSSTGATTFTSANAGASNYTHTFPAYTGNVVVTSTGSPAQGDVVYFNGTQWVDLGPGTNGYFLETQGASANPIWAASTGSGTVTSITCGAGLLCTSSNPITTTGTISPSVSNNAQTGASYAILSTDGGKLVSASNSGAQAYTIVAASTTNYTAGFAFDLNEINTGTMTLTPATSNIDGQTTLPLTRGQDAYIWSDSTNYHAFVSMPLLAANQILGQTGAGWPVAQSVGTGFLTAAANNTNGAGGFCVIGANACAYKSATIGWIATVNPNNAGVLVFPAAATLVSLVGNVETATGSAATVSVNVASSGTACSAGTTVHSGSFNANGTAATNQTLTLTTTAITSGQRLCLQTTGTTSWTGGTGVGTLTVTYTIP